MLQSEHKMYTYPVSELEGSRHTLWNEGLMHFPNASLVFKTKNGDNYLINSVDDLLSTVYFVYDIKKWKSQPADCKIN